MPQGKGTYGSQVGRPRKKKRGGSLLKKLVPTSKEDLEKNVRLFGPSEKELEAGAITREFRDALEDTFKNPKENIDRLTYNPDNPMHAPVVVPDIPVGHSGRGSILGEALVSSTRGATLSSQDLSKLGLPATMQELNFSNKSFNKGGSVKRQQYQEGTNWLEKRLDHAINAEIKQINQYGDKYWNSGTGLFGPLKRTLGDSGQGLRLYQEMMSINKEMKGQYTPLELFTRANQAFTSSGLAEQYRLTESYLPKIKKAEGGEAERPSMEEQMEGLAISVAPVTAIIEEEDQSDLDIEEEFNETEVLPDEQMESNYVDYVIDQTLSDEDKNYLDSALMEDAKLSEIFDQVVESAAEFSGSGPVEGLGTEVSDSIPARLSDGEFVFTAKAADEIGADQLQRLMKDAEAGADQRQGVAYGGMVEDEGDPKAVPIQTRGSVVAQGNIPNVVKQSRQVEEEMLKSSPRRYYVPVSG